MSTVTADAAARVIPLSKAKLRFVLYASLVFVAAGLLFWLYPELFRKWPPEVVRVVGLVAAAGFAVCAAYAAVRQRDPGPGLVIDAVGIIDRSSGVAAGRIPWSDIKGFKVHQVQHQLFLAVEVHEPQKYLARASALMRPVVALNLKVFGSPIQISAATLDVEFEELVEAVTRAHARARR